GIVEPWVGTVTRLSWLMSAVMARGRSNGGVAQHGAGRHQPGLEVTPQRHHQLARQRHDGDAADATLLIAHPRPEPAREVAVGLMREPQPADLDGCGPGASVARLTDPLLAPARSAVVRRTRQSEIAAELPSIVEVAVEHLVDQLLRAGHAETFEPGEMHDLGLVGAGHRRAQLGPACRLYLPQLLVDQAQPLVLARDLLHELRRQRPAVARAQTVETVDEPRLQRHGIANALAVQQRFDPRDMRRALLAQPRPLAV